MTISGPQVLNRLDQHLPTMFVIHYLFNLASLAQAACVDVIFRIQTRKARLAKGSGLGFAFREEANFIYLQVRIRELCSRFRPSRMCSTKYHSVPPTSQRPQTLAQSLTLSALVHCRFYGTWSFVLKTSGCCLQSEGWSVQELF